VIYQVYPRSFADSDGDGVGDLLGITTHLDHLFRDGRGQHGELPPNNWESVFGGRAWTRVTEPDGRPGQWYLHLFDSRQPDLNWENLEVRAEFEDVLRFWLDRGVDGFRVDVAHGMIKAAGLPDWAGHVAMIEGDEQGTAPGGANPMFDQEGVHEIFRAWRRVLEEYPGDRVMVAEAWVDPLPRLARYVRPDELHQAFNFDVLVAGWDALRLRRVIESSFAANDAVGAPTTWVLSNHDVVRHASRLGLPDPKSRPNGIGPKDVQPDADLGLRRARAATLLVLALPGSAYLYQGEELGLPDHTELDESVRTDPAFFRTGGEELGRDGCRVPLPWRSTAPAFGFSPTGATWLPQPEVWAHLAVDVQRGRAGSTYELYRTALRLRREHDLGTGDMAWAPDVCADESVLAFAARDVLVVANLGAEPVPLPHGARVLVASGPLLAGEGDALSVPSATTVWAVTA
jgi:alpha-glucosidase